MSSSFFGRLFNPRPTPDSETMETRANRGEAAAQFGLGVKFANEGLTQDFVQAAHWYLKAAEQSHGLAQFNLGMMYALGQGMPRDDAKAFSWIQTAANLGDAGAQYRLGMRHHRASLGETQEPAVQSRIEAYKWLHLAAAQGYVGSDAACAFVTVNMTIADVSEAARNVAAFVPATASTPDR